MRWVVSQEPSYTILKVGLSAGESVTAEPGAMVLMRGPVEIKTHTGGILSGLARALAGGESMWLNTYVAKGSAEVWFAPNLPGDIIYRELRGEELFVQDTSYLAHHGDVKVSVGWRGFRGLLAEGQLVWLKVVGTGGVWMNAYGGVETVSLGAGERMVVDNFHFVAMTSGMKWRVRKFGGIKSFLLSGEGIVIEVEGPGTVYLQTRSLPPFVGLIAKYLKR